MRIVSISRRTDVPAFYTPWLMNRLRAGFCHWINPFGGQVYQVSLRAADCAGLVFWTRMPKPLLPHLDEIRALGHRFYFHVSLTGYPAEIESHNPILGAALDAFRALSDRISPRLALWRYDPILLSSATPADYHAARFETLARALEGRTERCYFSFVDLYGKTKRNLAAVTSTSGIRFDEPDVEARLTLTTRLRDIGKTHGITLYSCCEDGLLAAGVEKAHCVHPGLLDAPPCPVSPTREECGCAKSVDIGAYDTCRFGCSYCYATGSHRAAVARAQTHDPGDTALWRPPRLAYRDLHVLEPTPTRA